MRVERRNDQPGVGDAVGDSVGDSEGTKYEGDTKVKKSAS